MTPIRHALPFDPTYGLDEAALRAIAAPPAPAGFDDFWRSTRAAADAVPLNLSRRVVPCADAGWRLSEVEFDALGGFRIGAWLLEPQTTCRAGQVIGHGYGGRGEVPRIDPAWPQAEPTAMLFPCMPGFHRSAHPLVPGEAGLHVVHGIAARDTYILRFCVAATWAATRALADLCPSAAARLSYHGGSFGGGLGALAAPWEPAWRCARFDVPTFGHHPWRLRCPCNGSGEAVRRHHAAHPEVAEVLAFYDAAVAASRIAVPVYCCPARFDPAVPPPGQWAVANALGGPHEIMPLISGHFDGPWAAEENSRVHAGWVAFQRRHLL